MLNDFHLKIFLIFQPKANRILFHFYFHIFLKFQPEALHNTIRFPFQFHICYPRERLPSPPAALLIVFFYFFDILGISSSISPFFSSFLKYVKICTHFFQNRIIVSTACHILLFQKLTCCRVRVVSMLHVRTSQPRNFPV